MIGLRLWKLRRLPSLNCALFCCNHDAHQQRRIQLQLGVSWESCSLAIMRYGKLARGTHYPRDFPVGLNGFVGVTKLGSTYRKPRSHRIWLGSGPLQEHICSTKKCLVVDSLTKDRKAIAMQ